MTPDSDDPVVPTPSASVSKGIQGAIEYMDIISVFEKMDFEDIGTDSDKFCELMNRPQYPFPGYNLLEIVFSTESKADDIVGFPYLEVEDEKYYLRNPDRNAKILELDRIEIVDKSGLSVLYEVDKVEGTLDIDIKGLHVKAVMSKPTGYTIDVNMSIKLSAGIEKYDTDETGKDLWRWSEDRPIQADISVNGETWPSCIYEISKMTTYYGDETYRFGYMVEFDSDGGESVDPVYFLKGSTLDSKKLPATSKKDAVFKGWVLPGGTLLDDLDVPFSLEQDITLKAVYWDTVLPEELEMEAYQAYRFFEKVMEIDHTGRRNEEVYLLFGTSKEEAGLDLLDMFFLLYGKTDRYGSYPYFDMFGAKFYGSVKDTESTDESSESFAVSDYDFSIVGGGSSSYHEAIVGDDSSEEWTIGDVQYMIFITPKGGTSNVSFRAIIELAKVTEIGRYDSAGNFKRDSLKGEVSFYDEVAGKTITRTFYYNEVDGIGIYGDYLVTSELFQKMSKSY